MGTATGFGLRILVFATVSMMALPANSENTSDDYGLLWSAQLNEGVEVEDVEAFLNDLLEDVSKNSGTLVYEIVRVENTFYGYERYDDGAAFLASLVMTTDGAHGQPIPEPQTGTLVGLAAITIGLLHHLAAQKLAHEKPGQTLQATALVHEAYLRLIGPEDPQWDSRGHFFAAAAEAMRRILVESARRKQQAKHGGGREQFELLEGDLERAHSSGLERSHEKLQITARLIHGDVAVDEKREAVLGLERQSPRRRSEERSAQLSPFVLEREEGMTARRDLEIDELALHPQHGEALLERPVGTAHHLAHRPGIGLGARAGRRAEGQLGLRHGPGTLPGLDSRLSWRLRVRARRR